MNMMSSENILTKPAVTKEENQNPGNRKAASSSRPQEQALKCPRCDSPNTKFCYYNNYSLTQPRHFCKTCRRYWTKGGALRSIPIGGGCRKNKKMIKSSSRLSGDSNDSGSSSGIGGFKLFHGFSPAMDFQLGGLSFPPQNSLGDPSDSSANHLMGFNYPLSSVHANTFSVAIQEMGSLNVNSNLASSIESLSSINQDLHWRLQQQRLGTSAASAHLEPHTQKPQPILFQNLENSRKEGASGESSATEWFYGNSYAPVVTEAGTATTTRSSGGNDNTINNWNGVQAWSDLHRYSAFL